MKVGSIKNKQTLKTNLLKKLLNTAEKYMPNVPVKILFPKKKPVTVYHLENRVNIYSCEQKPIFAELNTGEIIPHLSIAISYPNLLPFVFVNEGAVRPLLRGADLMARGVIETPIPYDVGAVVEVRLQGTDIPFAIGVAVVSSNDTPKQTSGSAIKIAHCLRDGFWNVSL
jgi:PUA domain protein